MPYVRTKIGTASSERREPGGLQRVVRAFSFFVPVANPDYEARLHLVHEWVIEFDESGEPRREIGLDAHGLPVLSGPDQRNCGFWLDTNMRLTDFSGEPISREAFERLWQRCAGERSASRPTRACS